MWRPTYATADELEQYCRVEDDLDEQWFELAVEAASRAIDEATNRQFGRDDQPTTRRYTPRRHPRVGWLVDIDDLMDNTDLQVRLDDDEVTGHWLRPANAPITGEPWTQLVLGRSVRPRGVEDEVEVTARFGWDMVPDTIMQATLLQGSRIIFRRDAPSGVAGSPEQGSELRLLARVDPDVQVMLSPFVRYQRRVG